MRGSRAPWLCLAVTALLLGGLRGRARAETATEAKPPDVLGVLEKESVDDALASLGLTVDPEPRGKVVRQIHVVSHDVFSSRDGRFQWLNVLHRTTRAAGLKRELLLEPGQVYDEELVEESIRRIQSPPPFVIAGRRYFQPGLFNVVALLPVRAPEPGQVDLLLVTRDLWSLRTNTEFEFQQDRLTYFQAALADNNLMGWRKFASLSFGFDQGAYHYGPTYVDPNIRGSRLTLWTNAVFYTSRATGHHEGHEEMVSLHYPLYALSSRWGGGIDVVHQNIVPRVFQGNMLRPVDLAATPELEALPYAYRRRSVTVDGSIVRAFGQALIQRLTLGHLVELRRAYVLPDFPAGPEAARLFLDEWTPTVEQRSEPYLRYDVFTPRYAVLRDFGTFDLRETRLVGFIGQVRISQGLPELGADFRALGLSAIAGVATSPRGGYLSVMAGASARLRYDQSRWLDQTAMVGGFAASPMMGGIIRLVATLELNVKRGDTTRTPYILGGAPADRGYHVGELNGVGALRGYQVGEFLGTTVFAGHLEARTAALHLASQRFGAALLYDVGHAATTFSALVPHHDVGAGVRWLIPQLNSAVVRIDWVIPLQDGPLTRAGLPGRAVAGFQQVF